MLAFDSGFDTSIFWTWCFKTTLLLVYGFEVSSFVTAVSFVTYSSHDVCPAAVNLISFSVTVGICDVGTTSFFCRIWFFKLTAVSLSGTAGVFRHSAFGKPLSYRSSSP